MEIDTSGARKGWLDRQAAFGVFTVLDAKSGPVNAKKSLLMEDLNETTLA
jgi:hypothetical protein